MCRDKRVCFHFRVIQIDNVCAESYRRQCYRSVDETVPDFIDSTRHAAHVQSELQQSGCSAGGRPGVEASSRHDVAEPDRRQRYEAEVRADQDVPLGLPVTGVCSKVRQVSVLR